MTLHAEVRAIVSDVIVGRTTHAQAEYEIRALIDREIRRAERRGREKAWRAARSGCRARAT